MCGAHRIGAILGRQLGDVEPQRCPTILLPLVITSQNQEPGFFLSYLEWGFGRPPTTWAILQRRHLVRPLPVCRVSAMYVGIYHSQP